jgi:hypothetical protein
MLNKNAITIITPMYLPAEEYTLDQAINTFIKELDKRVYHVYNVIQGIEEAHANNMEVTTQTAKNAEFIVKNMYSSGFYKVIDSAPDLCKTSDDRPIFYNYKFSINPKSINFESCISDIKERYLYHHDIPLSKEFEQQPIKSKKVWTMKHIPNWENLFGEKEFPRIHIVLFRLGNNEYYGAEFIV